MKPNKKQPAALRRNTAPLLGWSLAAGTALVLVALILSRRAPLPASDSSTTNAVAPTNATAGVAVPPPATSGAATNTAEDLLNLGTERLAQGDAAGAEALYWQAQKLSAEDEEVYFNLGVACEIGRASCRERV